MTEESVLKPDKIKKQSYSAIFNLSNDNLALIAAENKLNEFCSDKSLEGKSFESLRQQLSDYLLVIRSLRSANESDIADFKTLNDAVGDEVLIGATIIEERNKALEEKNYYYEKMEEYFSKLNLSSPLTYISGLSLYYMQQANNYSELSMLADETCRNYEKKMAEYDRIETETKNLFSQSRETRKAAQTALNDLGLSFVDGKYIPNMSAKWRSEILSSYYNRVFVINEDGTSSINLYEVKKIINKKASSITNEEYNAITLAFINANANELSSLIQFFMCDRKDVRFSNIFDAMYGDNYSEWTVDKTKMSEIINRSILWYEYMNATNQNIENINYDECSIVLQRVALMSSILNIETFRGEYGAEYPRIDIYFQNESENGKWYDIFVSFREYGERPVYNWEPNYHPFIERTTPENLNLASITISRVIFGSEIDENFVDDAKNNIDSYFGIETFTQDASMFLFEEVSGELVDQATDKVVEITASNLIGMVPYVGDLVSFFADVQISYIERNENKEYVGNQLDKVSEGNVFSDFDCKMTNVTYNTYGINGKKHIIYPGDRTDEIIRELNNKFNMNFSREMVFGNPDNAEELLDEARELQPDVVDAILKNKEY